MHPANGSRQFVEIGHPLLQQVRPPLRSVLEQAHRIVGFHVLAQHDDAHLGMFGPDLPGGPNALVGLGGRHPNVGDDHVGPMLTTAAIRPS